MVRSHLELRAHIDRENAAQYPTIIHEKVFDQAEARSLKNGGNSQSRMDLYWNMPFIVPQYGPHMIWDTWWVGIDRMKAIEKVRGR